MRENLYHPLDKSIPEYLRSNETLRKIDTYLLGGNYEGGFAGLWADDWERRRMGLAPVLCNAWGISDNKNIFNYSWDSMKDSKVEMAARIILW